MLVQLGSDRLLRSGRLTGRRVGIVSNPASVGPWFAHIVDRVAALPGVTTAALFGPQHGFRADVQDNMIESAHARDARRQIPVYSLYSETREPTAAMLEGIDLLIIDLQDVGARIYTFVYTMANCLRAAARHGIEVVVCDRPNPIGGDSVEGPMLVPGFESFVGLFPIPMRHGMTMGELARLFNEEFGIGASLEVAAMDGVAARDALRRHGAALGDALAEHADARHGGCLSRRRAVRGDDDLGGAGHDAPVRNAGRAVDRRRGACLPHERPRPRRRAFPAGRLRARPSRSTQGSAAAAARFT